MKIAGVIAEYNPFHNGHRYHLEQTRRISGADYIVAVLSGDFVQRGAPAIMDKHGRTEMALRQGVDLVLELPAVYASGSAEFFAMGAVSLLDKLGCIDYLCFGSECGHIGPLSAAAALLAEEREEYRSSLQRYLKSGDSFPKARCLALQDHLPANADAIAANSPNDILGVEYLKALQKRNSPILPLTVRREGSAYHDLSLNGNGEIAQNGVSPLFSSASAIRKHMEENGNIAGIEGQVPDDVFQQLKKQAGKACPVGSNDFSSLLMYKLLLERENGFSRYQDITPALSDKIKKHMDAFECFEQFCLLLKSKDMAYSRISRCLTHILLDMAEPALQEYIRQDYISYARILGFKKKSAPLLSALKAHTSVPLVSKLADAHAYLGDTGFSMLEKDIQTAHIYGSVVSAKFRRPFLNEYTRPLTVLS